MFSSKFITAAILVAVSFWSKRTHGQEFSVLSCHDGEIDKVLVTVSSTDIEDVLSGYNGNLTLVSNLLCTFHDYQISSCMVYTMQVQVCKPLEERGKFLAQLDNHAIVNLVGDKSGELSKWSERIYKLNQDHENIKRLEAYVASQKKLIEVDLNEQFWEVSANLDLTPTELSVLNKTKEWYEAYRLLLEDIFNSQWDELKKDNPPNFCGSERATDFSLVKHCEEKSYENEMTFGSSFSQDEFLVVTNDKVNKVVPRLTTKWRNGDLLNRISESPCMVPFDTASIVDIQGGNMLVSGPFALIGMDVLKEWYTIYDGMDSTDSALVEHRLNHIGLDTSTADSLITTRLERALGKKIIWVGSKNPYWNFLGKKSSDLEKPSFGYQPIWHIDLFLHPISYERSDGQSTMKILVSMPDEKWQLDHEMSEVQSQKRRDIITTLTGRINECVDTLVRELKRLDVVCDTVHVPLALSFAGGTEDLYDYIYDYFSYCNGLVHRSDSESVFFAPFWSHETLKQRFASHRVEESVANKLKRAGLKYVGIEGQFGQAGALHCKVLVTERAE